MDDPVFLARLQFGLTIAFHYLFPPITIGLGLLMVIMEGLFLWTKNHEYESIAKFWTRIFALIFAVGVASGIVMEFQFGLNWAAYSRFVGDVFGAALAAEGIFAFFLESGFLAVLVFGWDKVRPPVHFIATVLVSLGSMFSAIWIVVANSWQQTPAGHHLVTHEVRGEQIVRAELTDFWTAILNPSTLERLTHTLIGAMIMGGFFVLSVSAFYLLKGRHEWFARRSIAIALPFTAVFSVLQLWSGHENAQMVGNTQPAKLAAFEGHFRTAKTGTGLSLWGMPDVEAGRLRYGVAIPGMLSYLMYGDWNRPVAALDDPVIVPPTAKLAPQQSLRDFWPPVNLTFQVYHLMVGLGFLFILLTVVGTVLLWRKALFRRRWLLWVFVFAVILPVLANQAGWFAAEVGRQPWVVYGLMRTSAGVSQVVTPGEIVASIIGFGLVYLMLFLVWVYIMDHKIKAGPDDPATLATEFRQRGWLAAATARTSPAGESMTEAHPSPGKDMHAPEGR